MRPMKCCPVACGMPSYRKVNPTQALIMVLALTSEVLEKVRCMIWRKALLQKLSQVVVGDVQIGGSSFAVVERAGVWSNMALC